MARKTEVALRLAEKLLGGVLSRGQVGLRVVEVEAYGERWDSASHARFGVTGRTWPMFESEGTIYVYLCYGIHWMVNLAAGPAGEGGAVLIRGAEVVRGRGWVARRRGRDPSKRGALAGPGKVGQALGATSRDSGAVLGASAWDFLPAASRAFEVFRGPRIGIGYAAPEDQARPWRLWLASEQVSSLPMGIREAD